jgi:hemerythrin
MALINWDDSFSVNIAAIDKEHKMLLAMLNELDARNGGVDKDALGSILIRLIEYAATHFRTEEQYFAQFGYPETESHKRDHVVFLQECAVFIEELEEGKTNLTSDVTHFLRNWWKDHVMGTDKKYSQFLNENGLK